MSDSVRPHRWQPTRLPCPWDFPGKNTGVGCHCLLQCMEVQSESEVAQSCPTLSDPMDYSPPGSSIHGIFQARVLEWGAIAFSDCTPREVLFQGFSNHCQLKKKKVLCESLLEKQILKFDNHCSRTRRGRWHPTPVLLPGKSHGWRSLVGCGPWGRWKSDTTE